MSASAIPRQQRRGARTAARLVEATLRCLERDGYSRLSVENIITEAGVSRGAMFHHFDTKQDLVAVAMAAFLDQRIEGLSDNLQAIGAAERGTPASLFALTKTLRQDAEVILEVAVALRTDEDLRARVARARIHVRREEAHLTNLLERIVSADLIWTGPALIAITSGARAYEIVASDPPDQDRDFH